MRCPVCSGDKVYLLGLPRISSHAICPDCLSSNPDGKVIFTIYEPEEEDVQEDEGDEDGRRDF